MKSIFIFSCLYLIIIVSSNPIPIQNDLREFQSSYLERILEDNNLSSKLEKVQKHFAENVLAEYPQFNDLDNTEIDFFSINSIIEQSAIYELEKGYYSEAKITYEIKYASDNLLSILFSGSYVPGEAPFINLKFWTLNVDIKAGQAIHLKDLYSIDEYFLNSILRDDYIQCSDCLPKNKKNQEEFIKNYILQDNIEVDFFNADTQFNEPLFSDMSNRRIFSYYTNDSLGILIPVLKIQGWVIRIEIPYSKLLHYEVSRSTQYNQNAFGKRQAMLFSTSEIPCDTSLEDSSLLISSSIYQVNSRWIGSGYGATYYFADNGWYCYIASDYGIKEENEIVSQRGQWTLNEQTITLTIKEQITTKGGDIEWSPITGNTLANYSTHYSNINQTIVYDFSIQHDEVGYYLAVEPMSLYPSIPYNETVNIFASEGYQAYTNLPEDRKNIWQLNLPIDVYNQS